MNTSKEQLKSIVERIERLDEEKKAIADDIRDIYAEAKANGFDVKALRQIIADRKMEKSERDEFEAIVDTYRIALGMLPDFESAQERVTGNANQEARSAERATGNAK